MKSSPCSNATANVRPDFSSLVLMSILGFHAAVRGIPLAGTASRGEGPPDLGAVSSAGDEQVQQEAGLERCQVSGATVQRCRRSIGDVLVPRINARLGQLGVKRLAEGRHVLRFGDETGRSRPLADAVQAEDGPGPAALSSV